MMKRALLSVSDKTGLVAFAAGLRAVGFELVSTGGTAQQLRDAGIDVVDIAAYTGSPEILGGRVKTLHPKVHGGILFRRDAAEQVREAQAQGIGAIDLVAVNLYPFAATIAEPGCSDADAVEQIDIGGPTMLRAAAKNHQAVAVVVDPNDYDSVLAALKNGGMDEAGRRRLAAKAFDHTARYDRMIADFFGAGEALRYGENPHQKARLLGDPALPCGCEQLHGKALSYNNLLDLDAGLDLIAEFDGQCAVAILKHNNPCGVASLSGGSIAATFRAALACDPVSAFGGIVASSQEVDLDAAEAMAEIFLEVIVAPSFSAAALERLQRKKNLRLMVRRLPFDAGQRLRSVQHGALIQDCDRGGEEAREVVTARRPTEAEQAAMELAWKVVKHVRSNAIVFATAEQAVAIGAGQMSRVDAAELAIARARLPLTGCAVGSDAFFPFRDGLDVCAKVGASAVIQPGGSKRDDEVIDAANEHDMAMVMTATRHFRH
jgi:phosphoribosylaminoimidazolecarboxamide formyltransferase/IMP cyclohydrolase